MRFADVNNELIEAAPKLKGCCPGCKLPVIAKCGTRRIHHWANYKSKMCVSWWEDETEWHRLWKSHFPPEWQEVFLPDEQTGEKHIADIRTSEGVVIEFQHSHIELKERTAREQFYQNMVWVVDGTRLKRDVSKFLKGKKYHKRIRKGIFEVYCDEHYFPSIWLESGVPVICDFRGAGSMEDNIEIRCNSSDLIRQWGNILGSWR